MSNTERIFALALAAAVAGCGGQKTLVLGATTTIEDSGLLDTLVTAFTAAHPDIRLTPITSASDAILAMGRRGDLDVMLTHDPAGEARFMEEGLGLSHQPVMHNAFLIVGPASDPAGVRGMHDAVAAMARIAQRHEPFVSRGDSSGTNRKELQLWKDAGLSPSPRRDHWYIDAGVAMGAALLLANERQAYILTEPATYYTVRHSIALVPLVEGDARLTNRYAVTIPASSKNVSPAREFARWITGPPGRALIEHFGERRLGRTPFQPGAPPDTP
ncbi:MAG TPA: substrate-binding domain-containing protein [Longimicrobiales bacterium]|nr:substrate-binding domain-containing protein [Longimicrobiales bacterium]